VFERRLMMKPNVVILTSGLTGSSVLTGLIARAGYWTGDRTHKKNSTEKNEQYNTHENAELIDLNLRLFREAGYHGSSFPEFSPELIGRIADLAGKIDDTDYRAFLSKCSSHEPWIWKEPRLWLTIRFWRKLWDFDGCKFILLTRGCVQCWVSTTLRKQIRTYRSLTAHEDDIKASFTNFVEENHLPCLSLRYEDLIQRPAETLEKLNDHLGLNLTVDDLQKVYTKPLYKAPRSPLADYAKAALIYLWNYSERIDVPTGRE
jgi:hypothetical protein